MNYTGHHHAEADPWCSNRPDDFADMIGDLYTDDDLFGLAEWGQGGGGTGGAAAPGSPVPPPEVRRFDHPPSEEEMAAWLGAIVEGQELALNQQTAAGGRDVPAKGLATTVDEKLPMAEEEGTGTQQQEMRKTPGGGGGYPKMSRSHHGEAHSLTEKRRRNKINEKLRTLQQLVPGCDGKCNQVATLEQTIQYMKSLQHQVQAMCCVGGGPARPLAAAAYPVPVVQAPQQHAPPPRGAAAVAVPMTMPAAPVILAAAPTTMVPFRAMQVQLHHYPAAAVPAVMTMPAATAAPLYPAAAAAPVARPGGACRSTGSHRHGSSSSSKGNGSGRSLRPKH